MGADFVGKFKDHRTKEMKLLLICIKSMIKLGAYKLCFFFFNFKTSVKPGHAIGFWFFNSAK